MRDRSAPRYFANADEHLIHPQQAAWSGSVQLPEVKVPIRMELDLTGTKPTGHFINGIEKTPIPEISRNGDTVTFNFFDPQLPVYIVFSYQGFSPNLISGAIQGARSIEPPAGPETEWV
jgi:hypothetical protein